MTTSTLHTPLEELLFFQSLRANGINSESFTKISETLKANKYIHSSEDFEPERLSPGNLKLLYLRLLKDEARSSRQTSPKHDPEQNGRKRKLSTPPLQSIDEAAQHAHLLPRLVDRLYARYQSHLVEAIKEDERIYNETRKAIEEIERGDWDERLQAEEKAKHDPHKGTIQNLLRAETKQADAVDNKAQAHGSSLIQEQSVKHVHRQMPPNTDKIDEQPQKVAAQSTQPSPPPTEIFQPPSRPPAQNHVPSQANSTQSNQQPQGNAAIGPPTQGIIRQDKATGTSAGSPANGPSRNLGSPIVPLDNLSEKSTRPNPKTAPQYSPQHGQLPNLPPHPYALPPHPKSNQAPYPYQSGQLQYSQYPPYGHPVPGYPPHQAQKIPPYANPAQPFSTTQPPQPSNGPYPLQATYNTFPGFPPDPPQPVPSDTSPQFATPTQPNAIRRQALTPINTAVSATKWKSTPRPPGKAAPRSPTPPDRSPMLPSSPETSPEPEHDRGRSINNLQDKVKETPSKNDSTPTRGRGRGRWGGHSGRGRGGRPSNTIQDIKDTPTRSQSVVSNGDDPSTETTTRKGIRHELPSTPLAITDDTSAISTPGSANRAGRRNTLRGLEISRPGTKRKRANTLEDSPEVFVPPTPHIPNRPGQVLASRNFPRIVAPLMNDINSHKHASLFAKPIMERDVPGYHNLIYRVTNLKSIRAAISLGSRTLAASTAADPSFNASVDESVAAATPPAGTPNASTLAANRSGTIWVERAPDLEPPRGIVNSSQLEKEITRMFANAVMFNADSHRGFGRLLSRRQPSHEDEDEDDEEVEGHYEVDDGGAFVRDAREMFEDVERSVARWRAAERVDRGADARVRGGEGKDESEADEVVEEEGESSRGRRARG